MSSASENPRPRHGVTSPPVHFGRAGQQYTPSHPETSFAAQGNSAREMSSLSSGLAPAAGSQQTQRSALFTRPAGMTAGAYVKIRAAMAKERRLAAEAASQKAEQVPPQPTANLALKRARSPDEGDDEVPAAKTSNRQLDGAMRLATPAVNSGNIMAMRARRCFFQVNSGRIVGTSRLQNGWRASMYINGGKDGDPRLELRLRANNQKEMKNEPVILLQNSEYVDLVIFRFRPGVRSQSDPTHWTMENYETHNYATHNDNRVFPSSIVERLNFTELSRLKAFRFQVNGNASNDILREAVWARYAESGVVDVLRPMLDKDARYTLTIWTSNSIREAERRGGDCFKQACDSTQRESPSSREEATSRPTPMEAQAAEIANLTKRVEYLEKANEKLQERLDTVVREFSKSEPPEKI